MTALDQLTPVQVEAIEATAAQLLRDPEELAVELFPLIYLNPFQEAREAALEPVTQAIPAVPSPVNESLTPNQTQEIPRS